MFKIVRLMAEIYTGSTVYLRAPHTLEAPPFYLRSSPFQRWFCGLRPLLIYLLLPGRVVHVWEPGLLGCCQHKNEYTPRRTCCRDHTATSFAGKEGYKYGDADGSSTSLDCYTFHYYQSKVLFCKGFPANKAISFQMDRELEICRRGGLPLLKVCSCSTIHELAGTLSIHSHSLDTSIRHNTYGIGKDAHQASAAKGTTTNIEKRDTGFRHDHDPHILNNRSLMCSKSPLPVLCLYRLVHAFLALEDWDASTVPCHDMGGARVGLEHLSKH